MFKTSTLVFFNKVWQLFSGLFTIVLITRYFTPEVQGFYYTFNSLYLFYTLFEAGFCIVLTQSIAHCCAEVSTSKISEFNSNEFRALTGFGIYFYLFLSLLFLVFSLTFGIYFLTHKHNSNFSLITPWIIYALAFSFQNFNSVFRCILEGTNQVKAHQKISFLANIASNTILWVAIYSNLNLYAPALMMSVLSLTTLILSILKTKKLIHLPRISFIKKNCDWKKTILPQQLKITASWISGFLIFQSFVPIVFHFRGPIDAGKMGLLLQIYNAVNSLAGIFLVAAGPTLAFEYKRKNYKELNLLIKQLISKGFTLALLFSCLTFTAIFFIKAYYPSIFLRFPDLISIACFLMVAIFVQISNVETLAIRFQGKEPFFKVSILSGMLVIITNYVMSKYFNITEISYGFCVIMLFFLIPICHKIYNRNHLN